MHLTGVLDGARKRSPRLNFLSDAELARLLSVHYEPAALTPFVRRLFPAAALRELHFALPTDPAPLATRPARRETTRTSADSVATATGSGPGATGRSTRSSRPATTKRLEEKFNGALRSYESSDFLKQQQLLRH